MSPEISPTSPAPTADEKAAVLHRYQKFMSGGRGVTLQDFQAARDLLIAWEVIRPNNPPEGWEPPPIVSRAIGNPRDKPRGGGDRDRPPPGETDIGDLSFVRLIDVKPESYKWLWEGRIPLGHISLISGDGGSGKSTLILGTMVAVITTGGCFPDLPGVPVPVGRVLVFSAEENRASDLAPRCLRFGADCSRVEVFDRSRPAGSPERESFSLRRDVERLAKLVKERGDVRLIVFDPIGSYVSGTDVNTDSDVREALAPLRQLAEAYEVAIVFINHITKAAGADVLARIQGAAALRNVARMVWFCSEDPRDQRRRLLSWVKGNPLNHVKTGLSVGIDEKGILDWSPAPVDLTARQALQWLDRVNRRGEDSGKRGPVPKRMRETMDWLRKFLERADGRSASLCDLVDLAAIELGASRTAVYNAVRKMNGSIRIDLGSGRRDRRIILDPELPIGDPDEESA